MAYIGNTQQNQNYVPQIDYFSGNGSTTAFTLSRPVASVAQVQVVVNNVAQDPGSAFTVLNSTITFTSAPSSGSNNIYVYYTSPNTQVVQPGQGTVTNSSFAAGASEFATGTALLFHQTAAPTGWTKYTLYNNYALRVVSGTVTTGGTVPFTTAFASQTPAGSVSISGSVDQTTLSVAQLAAHNHSGGGFETIHVAAGTGGGAVFNGVAGNYYGGWYDTSQGSNNGHSHSVSGVSGSFSGTAINLAVQYVDAIICSKD